MGIFGGAIILHITTLSNTHLIEETEEISTKKTDERTRNSVRSS